MTPLNILHVFRSPVGGLFRHVADLARERPLAAVGAAVGVGRRGGAQLGREDVEEPALGYYVRFYVRARI